MSSLLPEQKAFFLKLWQRQLIVLCCSVACDHSEMSQTRMTFRGRAGCLLITIRILNKENRKQVLTSWAFWGVNQKSHHVVKLINVTIG